MAYVRLVFCVCSVLLLGGCSVFGRNTKSTKVYEEGYRQGAKENIRDFTARYSGNDYPYFNWSGPIVQDVRVPAHIENGLFVPEHNELVMIQPGEWRSKFAYPISGSDNKGKEKQLKGDTAYAIENINLGIRDITVLPKSYVGAKPAGKDKDTGR